MSNRQKKIDTRQLQFNFNRQIDMYRAMKSEILDAEPEDKGAYTYEEACIQIAVAVKKMVRKTGLSREQVVDAINDYFEWDNSSSKKLTIHMFNHYLSKPIEYPIPAFYIFAIQDISQSTEACELFAEAEDAQVISGDEVRQMTLGKIDENILELQKLKKELRNGRRI
jgi:hypothetical protein